MKHFTPITVIFFLTLQGNLVVGCIYKSSERNAIETQFQVFMNASGIIVSEYCL